MNFSQSCAHLASQPRCVQRLPTTIGGMTALGSQLQRQDFERLQIDPLRLRSHEPRRDRAAAANLKWIARLVHAGGTVGKLERLLRIHQHPLHAVARVSQREYPATWCP